MKTLYPEIEPYIVHRIAVDAEHTLKVEECGNPQGIPIVFLHGGPGSHCKAYHRCFFNPQIYRIILFDQRGAGASTPVGSLTNNTTQHLLADMEIIRAKLNLEKWIIFGGSWGATLGLLYAQAHPERILGLILRSIFLARQCDIHWFHELGAVSRIFPQQWENFVNHLPKEEQGDLLTSYYARLTGENMEVAHNAALAWATWEGFVISEGKFPDPTESSEAILNSTKMECHYMLNNCFIEENQLLNNLNKVKHIPTVLIHGQMDLVCPFDNSYLLAKNWGNKAQLKVVLTGNHRSTEPAEMLSTIVTVIDEMSSIVGIKQW